MTAIAIFLSRRKWWVGTWGALFLTLSIVLPLRPTTSVHGLGHVAMREFADDRTLIAHTWRFGPLAAVGYPSGPINILDLPTGRVRRIHLPDDSLANHEKVESDEEFERIVDAGWRLAGYNVSGQHVIVRMHSGLANGRLHIWNWQTGEEVLCRSIAVDELHWTVQGNRLLLQMREKAGQPMTFELWDVATGLPVATRFPGDEIPMDKIIASPDGKVIAQELDRGVRIWSLEPGAELFADLQAERFAFSSDSRLLATVSDWRRNGDVRERTWRVYEIPGGQQIAQRDEASSSKAHELHHAASLSFHDDNRCVAAYSHSPIFRSGSLYPIGLGPVAVWNWHSGETRNVVGSDSELYSASYSGGLANNLPTPRIVLDGKVVIDVATGLALATLASEFGCHAVSPVPRWAVVGDDPPQLSDQLANQVADLIAPLSTRLARPFRPGRRLQLFDFKMNRPVMHFAADHDTAMFSPDNQWLVTHNEDSLDIWSLPPRRSIGRAFLWSLIVPLLAVACGRPARRRHTAEQTHVA